jgi:hypothetical protein
MIFVAMALSLAAAARSSPAHQTRKWDIQITVECNGQYGLEDSENRYNGNYAFTIQWVGLMERDDEDFLLIHKGVALENWEVGEIGFRRGRLVLYQNDDFPDKPELRVNYILKKENGLHISLYVAGFDVPRSESAESFPLILPCSAEAGSAPAAIKYGAFITEGSNNVVIDEAAIDRGTEVKKFDWTWKYRAWIPRLNQAVLAVHSHKAVVTVAATPHQEDAETRPGDETGHRPAATGRG